MAKLLPLILLFTLAASGFAQNISAGAPFDSYGPFFYPDMRTPPPPPFGGGGSSGSDMFGGGKPAVYILYIITPSAPRVYWKDWTYDVYNGSGWLNSGNGSFSGAPAGSAPVQFQVYRVVDEGKSEIALIRPPTPGSDVLERTFAPNDSVLYSISGNSYNDHTLSISPERPASFVYNATFYNVTPSGRVGGRNDVPRAVYLQNTRLPDNFPKELRDAATNLTDPSLNMLQQTMKTRNFVKRHVNYNLSWGSGGLPAPGEDIALWTYAHRQGICGHYATLFAVLLRAQGIPARVATGYAGGLEAGNYTIIFGSYAHAWTEVYIPPYGWLPFDATGTSNATANLTRANESEMELEIEWSQVGKTTLDLQFSLDERTSSMLNRSQKEELEKLNRSKQGMNFSSQNQSGFRPNSFNWTNPYNRSNYSGLNYSQYNQSWNYNRSAFNQSAWNATNRTGYNQTNWTKKDPLEEQRKKDELGRQASADPAGRLLDSARSALSAAPPWLLVAAAIAAIIAAAYFLRRRPAAFALKRQGAPQNAEVRRWVDIGAVIRTVRAMGAEGRRGPAVVYGYNELADYIAYAMAVSNDPSLTAREFSAAAQMKGGGLLAADNVPALKRIVFIFEDTEYGEKVSAAQFDGFVAALEKLAGK